MNLLHWIRRHLWELEPEPTRLDVWRMIVADPPEDAEDIDARLSVWQQVRTQLGWPFGPHWCWHETVLWSVAAFVFVVNGSIIMFFGHPRLIAFPLGSLISGAGWLCARAVYTHWHRSEDAETRRQAMTRGWERETVSHRGKFNR